jgi:hypothetical protein
MTCRGYDPKSVKVSKTIKRSAATIQDVHKRGELIREYVRILENQARSFGRSKN